MAAVVAGTDAAGSPLVLSPEDMGDSVAPLRQRMKALEELKIRLARRSTRRISYRDFVTILSGASAFVSGAAAAAARIPARISETMSETMIPMQRRLSETMNSMGSGISAILSRASPQPSPRRDDSGDGSRSFPSASRNRGPPSSSNKVVPSSLSTSGPPELRATRSEERLHDDGGTSTSTQSGVGGRASLEVPRGSAHVLTRRMSEGSLSGGSSNCESLSIEGGRTLFQTPTGEGGRRSSQGSSGSGGTRSSDGGGGRVGSGRPPRHHTGAGVGTRGEGRDSLSGPPGVLAPRRDVLTPLSNRPPVPDPQTPPV